VDEEEAEDVATRYAELLLYSSGKQNQLTMLQSFVGCKNKNVYKQHWSWGLYVLFGGENLD
jgi:hypothetical protein